MSRCRWLITYDVSDNKRLRQIHRYLRGIATPLQKSVFLATLSTEESNELQRELRARINAEADSLECFCLTARVRQISLGRPTLPEGIWLF